MPKQFSVREVNLIAGKLYVDQPIGLMDRRWNLALETLMLKLKKLSDLSDEKGEISNVRPIKPVEKS